VQTSKSKKNKVHPTNQANTRIVPRRVF